MRILPDADEVSAFHWRAAAEGRLELLRCSGCRRLVYPPRAPCPSCGASELAPQVVSGRGTIYSFTISHHPATGRDAPFVLVLVALEEQDDVRMLAELHDCPLEAVTVGMAVEVAFLDVGEGVRLPVFRPRTPST